MAPSTPYIPEVTFFTHPHPSKSKRSTRDILVACTLASVYGILFILWNFVFMGVKPWIKFALAFVGLGPIGQELFIGFWFGVGVFVPYLVRRQGMAFLGQMVASLVQAPLTPWGLLALLSGFVEGIASEFVFWITRYKKMTMGVLLAAGTLPAFTSFAVEYPIYKYGRFPGWVQLLMFLCRLLSGIVLGVLFPKKLADALLRTKVLQAPSND